MILHIPRRSPALGVDRDTSRDLRQPAQIASARCHDERRLVRGSEAPLEQDASLLLLLWKYDPITWAQARSHLSQQLFAENQEFLDLGERPALLGTQLWLAVADQMLANAVARGVLKLEDLPVAPPSLDC